MSIVDAAVEAARIRLRPILMTSFAFVLGVLPLAIATGAGSGARNSVGTTVAGGMIASTFLSIIFIPVLYVAIRTIAPGRKSRGRCGAGGGGEWRQAEDVSRKAMAQAQGCQAHAVARVLLGRGPLALSLTLTLLAALPASAQQPAGDSEDRAG